MATGGTKTVCYRRECIRWLTQGMAYFCCLAFAKATNRQMRLILLVGAKNFIFGRSL